MDEPKNIMQNLVNFNDLNEVSESYFGLRDVESFKTHFIENNIGKPLFLIRFEQLEGMDLLDFVSLLRKDIFRILETNEITYGFHYIDVRKTLLMGLSPSSNSWSPEKFPNIENSIGRFHQECIKNKIAIFQFGVGRTQSNFISSSDEIFNELKKSSEKNLNDNLTRWSWTYFNKANTYISGSNHDAMIQPTLAYNPKKKTFSIKGGEVFVGGGAYQSYKDLITDIPPDQDINRIELLILEKLVIACEGAPGLLKFNISPQSLLDTFSSHEKVSKFTKLIVNRGIKPENFRFELVEKPYEEKEKTLKDVCSDFYNFGITFAADDFGVKSQSHQIVLDLGVMIQEFKLDPISFKFKIEEDQIKFLDNLAFIDYCKRLSDNREASITAEAVEDYDTLRFLLEHQIHQFQANMLFGKMNVQKYKNLYESMNEFDEKILQQVFNEPKLLAIQKKTGNILETAKQIGII